MTKVRWNKIAYILLFIVVWLIFQIVLAVFKVLPTYEGFPYFSFGLLLGFAFGYLQEE
jgi:MFS-type transporter involved in bile tolerance (Atg22 family)